jgi:hypothetical protein
METTKMSVPQPVLKHSPRRLEMLDIINKVIISHPLEVYNFIMLETSNSDYSIDTMPSLKRSLSRTEIITFINKFSSDNYQLLYNIIELYIPEFI